MGRKRKERGHRKEVGKNREEQRVEGERNQKEACYDDRVVDETGFGRDLGAG